MPVDATPDTYTELTGEGAVFVDFWGPRCQPCLAMMPTIADLEEQAAGAVRVVKVDSTQNREVCRELRRWGGRDQVTFGVDREDGCGEGLRGPGEPRERGRGRIGRRMEMEDDIHAIELLERELAHAHLHQVRGIQKSRQVVEDVLRVAVGADSGHGESGGLSARADDGEVLADDGVEEGRLADVGGAGEGDVAGSGHGGR